MSFAPADFESYDVGTTTAMPAVNAITAVVAAPAGVFTPLDLPLITARATSDKCVTVGKICAKM